MRAPRRVTVVHQLLFRLDSRAGGLVWGTPRGRAVRRLYPPVRGADNLRQVSWR
ncbi:hypothetical protein SFR_4543 [Streptomyces sp. FR-008]|nr:hypothetical protein SFR_4543 [Streptomyces sp. FR-008]